MDCVSLDFDSGAEQALGNHQMVTTELTDKLVTVGIETNKRLYGTDDASFSAAGGVEGIRTLVDVFFDRMSSDTRFAVIYKLHPDDLEISRDKLARFLCGWLGGPKKYNEKYGPISIPRDHQHLPIGEAERDQWLTCMRESVNEQPYREDFKKYLLEQLYVPAEGVRRRRAKYLEDQESG